MQTFSSIPAFVAVAECGSFSLAAQRLSITKSAVSKRITTLEGELGVKLFNRTTRKLSTTEAGRRYYDYAVRSLNLVQQGIDSISELQGEPRGKLRISAPMSFGVMHIAPYLSEFMQTYQEVDIDLNLDDKITDIVDEGYDLAIRIGQLSSSNLVAKRLTTCRSVLCASDKYLDKHGAPEHPSDLSQHNCLRYAYFRGGRSWVFRHASGEYKMTPTGRLVVNNSEAIRRAVLAGDGIAQLPTFLIGKDIVKQNVQVILPEYQFPTHAVYAVFSKREYLPLKVTTFIQFLSDKLGNDVPYWDLPLADQTK
ncbi:LysR family transcriptional regulator [Vibrio profundum]|uniref:LysR family transcriptional regulator n=1 Tax=Vibrio profundum TaxID=2910247 RepID=UPI003D100654